MKQKFFFSLIVISAILFQESQIIGQNSENTEVLQLFGLGMHIEQFKLSDITMDITTAPANKIVLTMTPTNKFRIEPEIGFNYLNDKESELKAKSVHFGVGGFTMYQKGKTNIYLGFRFEYANISNEYYNWNTGGKLKEKTNRLSIGPAIGAEFFFGDHFSFGGEIGLKYMSLETNDSQSGSDYKKQEHITTDSGLLLRFYF
ncbi:MAG: outer membrane beta-barrel protein [Bacteroidota bacterium]